MDEETTPQEAGVDVEKVVDQLTKQIGGLHLELAIRGTRIEQLEEEIKNMRTTVDAVVLQHMADEEGNNGEQKRETSKSR